MCAGNILSITKTLFKNWCWENQRNLADGPLWLRCLKKIMKTTQATTTTKPPNPKQHNPFKHFLCVHLIYSNNEKN